jgi:hypothetical protein
MHYTKRKLKGEIKYAVPLDLKVWLLINSTNILPPDTLPASTKSLCIKQSFLVVILHKL